MKNLKNKFVLPVKNGVLTDDNFVGDTPAIGSSDQRYSATDTEKLSELADELKRKVSKK